MPAPGGSNQKSPGIVIDGTCDLVIEGDLDKNGTPGGVVVHSLNQQAGDILLQFDRNITIDGTVRDEVTGTNGRPGKITIASCCGDIVTGKTSRIETIGVRLGGSDINIVNCCNRGFDGTGGDIVINGLVRAIHTFGAAPTINIVAFAGAVTIDGTTDLGVESLGSTAYRRTTGVYVQTLNATDGGGINIQAQDAVTVTGNALLNKSQTQFGAVAIKTKNTNGQGGKGTIHAVSLTSNIVATDRAFDLDNRFNHKIDTFIKLDAARNITLSSLTSSGAVVSSRGALAGQGGTNTLNAGGTLTINPNVQVLASATGGTPGTNNLFACGLVTTAGASVIPPPTPGVCTPVAPIFEDCEDLGVVHHPPT